MKKLTALVTALSPKQAATVIFVATFVTIIGGFALALYFRNRNRKLES